MNALLPDHLEEPGRPPLWLLAFADLTAILVAMFVLIYSMSSPMADRGSGVLSGANVETNLTVPNSAQDRFAGKVSHLADLTIGYLSAVLSERGVAHVHVGDGRPASGSAPISHRIDGDRLLIQLDPDFFFIAGDKRVQPLASGKIAVLSDVLSNVANPVSMISPVMANNWALAFDRADAMDEAFRSTGYAAPIERFVSPGISEKSFIIVVTRNGGRS